MKSLNNGSNDRALQDSGINAMASTSRSRVVISGPNDIKSAPALSRNDVSMLLMGFPMPTTVCRTAIVNFLEICTDLSALPRTEAYCTPKMFWKLDWEMSSIGCSANAECFNQYTTPWEDTILQAYPWAGLQKTVVI